VKTEHLNEVGLGSCLCCQAAQVPSCPRARAAVANLCITRRNENEASILAFVGVRIVASVCAKNRRISVASGLSHVDVLQVGRLTGLTKLYMVCTWSYMYTSPVYTGEHMRTWPRAPPQEFPCGILR